MNDLGLRAFFLFALLSPFLGVGFVILLWMGAIPVGDGRLPPPESCPYLPREFC